MADALSKLPSFFGELIAAFIVAIQRLFANYQMEDIRVTNGSFSGNPKTEWLVDSLGADRNMRLLEDFSYTDPSGRVWCAPIGSTIDGASIPRPLWVIVGSPYTDDYRRASIVHDIACGDPTVNRKEADVMFYFACLAGGCTVDQAQLLYLGVRIGAWTRNVFPLGAISRSAPLYRDSLSLANERFVQAKFDEVAVDLKALPASATIAEMDAVIEKHLKFQAAVGSQI